MTLMECPTCGRETAAVAFTGAGTFCPACAPTPELRPHNYRPVSGCDPRLAAKATGGVVKLTDAQARELSEPPGFVVFDEAHAFTESQWTAVKATFLGSRVDVETLKAYDDAQKATDDAIRTHALAAMALRNGVCCLDPGDCNGPCDYV